MRPSIKRAPGQAPARIRLANAAAQLALRAQARREEQAHSTQPHPLPLHIQAGSGRGLLSPPATGASPLHVAARALLVLLPRLKRKLARVLYRLGQVRQQLGFVAPLSSADCAEVEHWLPASAIALFQEMSLADQQHSLRVCRGLQARGCTEKDLLAAALLHDAGKGKGRVPFWTRPAIVIGKLCAPRLLSRLAVYPHEGIQCPGWRRSLGYAWYHAEVGAELAAAASLPERAVLYIRTHHQPNGPAAELHLVDEAS